MTQEQSQAAAHPAPGQGQAQPRTIAGRYVVHREIGRGGMGVVWLAEDRMIGRRVAIKELHLPDGVPTEERRVLEERVLREARAAGRLNDPAVITVHDVVRESGATFIVMELVEAPTLSDVVRQHGALPQEQVARLAEQVLSALETAHAAGVVHRDVKPSNIMLLPGGRVKLADFGIAQSLDDPRLTTSGVLVGSPTYIAPERIRGAEADAGSDLWSLGAVLFYAVEGHAAFERSTTVATMHAITSEVPYLTRCQGPLASVIMGLLISTPQARPTAAQVRALLSQVTTGPQLMPDQTALVPGTAPYPHANTTRMATGPSARPPRRRRPLIAGLAVVLVAGLVGGWFANQLLISDGEEEGGAAQAQLPSMTYGQGGTIPVFELSHGECAPVRLQPGRPIPSANSTPCDDVHDIEVFSDHDVNAPDLDSDGYPEYPGEEALREYGEAWCSMVFATDQVTPKDKQTTLSYRTLLPTKATWEDTDEGSQSVRCVLFDRDGQQLNRSLLAGY